MRMRLELTEGGAVAVAAITGEVDLANSASFADQLLGRMPDTAEVLIVDLTDLKYIDSVGVRSLFEVAAALRRRDQPVAVVLPEDSLIRSVLRITRLEEVAPMFVSADDAVATIRAPRV